MRSRTIIAIDATCALGVPTLAAEMPVTPYAGQQARQVQAPSDEDIKALREGMGMAKAAELNGYPGPQNEEGSDQPPTALCESSSGETQQF
jgi:hypothetical protein